MQENKAEIFRQTLGATRGIGAGDTCPWNFFSSHGPFVSPWHLDL